MTDEQNEMIGALESLIDRIRRDDVIGLVLGVVSRPRYVQSAVYGQCAKRPLETIGVVHMISRTLDEHLFATAKMPEELERALEKK